VLGALRELDDVPLRDPDVLEQAPRRERLARGPGSSQRGGPIGDDVLEYEVSVPTAQQLAHVGAQRTLGIHLLALRGAPLGGHGLLLKEVGSATESRAR